LIQVQNLAVVIRRFLLSPHVDRVLIQARQLGISLEELLAQLSERNSQLDASHSKPSSNLSRNHHE